MNANHDSNIQGLSPAKQGPSIDPYLQKLAEEEYQEELALLREYARRHPDSESAKANSHVLGSGEDTWHCAGSIEMAGVAWWALSVQMLFPPPNVRVFSAAGGPSWAASAFVASIVGSFAVPPEELQRGRYRFSLGQATFKVGGLRFALYDMNRKFLGVCAGVAAGAGIASLTGEGNLTLG